MARRVPCEMLDERVWLTPSAVEKLTERQAENAAEYLRAYCSTVSLWDSTPPMRRQTRYRGLFAGRFGTTT
jgi:hypothetical protein